MLATVRFMFIICVCPRTAWWQADGLCSWCLCVSLHSLMTGWWFLFMTSLCVLAQLDDWLMVYVHDICVCPCTAWWLADGFWSWCLCVSLHSLMTGWWFMFMMSLCVLAQLNDWPMVYVHYAPVCVLALPVTTNISGSQSIWCDAVQSGTHAPVFHRIMLLLSSILKMQAGCSSKTLWHTFIDTWNHITIHTAVSTSYLNKHMTWNHQILDTDVPQFSNNLGVSNLVLCIFYCSLKMWLILSSECLVSAYRALCILWPVLHFRSCVSEVTFHFKDTPISSVP
jgi:hypothetical protein